MEAPVTNSVRELDRIALKVRRNIVQMTGTAGSGHPGGSLSVVEILVSLYFAVMRYRHDAPCWPDRDRLILSKGHAAPALYAVLAEAGLLPADWLPTLRRLGSPLQGHPDCHRTPGVEISTGALGQGLSVANGLALALRLDGRPSKVYCVIGDGESDEGQVWEAAMLAAHYGLDNVVAILDYNKQQIDGWNREVMGLEPLADKWRAFGWRVVECDGHSFAALLDAFDRVGKEVGKPSVIVAHTTKGKGVSFMENSLEFHGKAPSPAQTQQALQELDAQLPAMEQSAQEGQ